LANDNSGTIYSFCYPNSAVDRSRLACCFLPEGSTLLTWSPRVRDQLFPPRGDRTEHLRGQQKCNGKVTRMGCISHGPTLQLYWTGAGAASLAAFTAIAKPLSYFIANETQAGCNC